MYIGNNLIQKLYLEATEINKMYFSDDNSNVSLIWDKGESNPTQIDYLTGAYTIDTDELFNGQNTKIEFILTINSISYYDHLYANGPTSSTTYKMRQENTNGFHIKYGWWAQSIFNPTVGVKYNVTQDANAIYIDGVFKQAPALQTFTTPETIRINLSRLNFHGLKIWQDGILVKEFIPCIDAIGDYCIWEKVTDTKIYASGLTI